MADLFTRQTGLLSGNLIKLKFRSKEMPVDRFHGASFQWKNPVINLLLSMELLVSRLIPKS